MIVGTTAVLRPSVGAVRLGRRTSVRQQRFEVWAREGADRVMCPLYLLEQRMVCLTSGNESSERRYVGDAWAHRGDEGRGKLR